MPHPKMKVAVWRARHRKRGETYTHQAALRCPHTDARSCTLCERDGYIYESQSVPSGAKILVWNSQADMQVQEFGVIPAGSTLISYMPDEMALSRLDRITLTQRGESTQERVTRGATATDALLLPPVVELLEVRDAAMVYEDGVSYQLTGNTIEWLVADEGDPAIPQPAEGTPYTVWYSYRPTYVFLGAVIEPSRPDADGAPMPQHVALEAWKPQE